MEPPPLPVLSVDLKPLPEAAAHSGLLEEHGLERADGEAWRDELAARLNRYRARRKAPAPRYPSLRLPFEAPILKGPIRESTAAEPPVLRAFETISNNALALDHRRDGQDEPAVEEIRAQIVELEAEQRTGPAARVGAKIIEFPRFAWGPPAPPPDQLAEPVTDRPRILDVPDVAPPPPALGGITIEPARKEEAERRPGIDFPLQSAPLGRRLLASLIDGLIVAAASAFFGFIFWKVTAIRPPRIQFITLAAGVACALWAAYQYLLIVYAASTPGLRLARLELARFDGSSTRRSLRRWRVLASYLSAASLGMGYAWVLLDEDSLCWHDRITHTYLAPGKPRAKHQASSSQNTKWWH